MHDLRRLSEMPLQIAANQHVELLIGAANLEIRFNATES